MWFQPPPPATNRWVLHVAAPAEQITKALHNLGINEQARDNGDGTFPVYLSGTGDPYGPPAWMAFARAELNRRGYLTRWCDPTCTHHPWPPRDRPENPTIPAVTDARAAVDRGHSPAGRTGPRTPLRRLTSGAPHHRTPAPAPATPART